MNEYIQTLFTAMIPVAELRVAIPLAITKFGLSAVEAYIVSVIGNMIPVVFLLLFLDPVSKFLSEKFQIFKRFFNWLFERTRKKITGKYEIYGLVALAIFVAIPLPATGAWSGCAAAYLLGLPFWKGFGTILAGVLIAGVIVTVASIGVISIF